MGLGFFFGEHGYPVGSNDNFNINIPPKRTKSIVFLIKSSPT